ncbi:hypothetical protein V1477_011338 [Vespula maculifrons]|uniref:Uncharacterized protein n=1 Tax=Vespula maculifrons TaxID=7453 RepID=A0ABD2C5A6_VESMC
MGATTKTKNNRAPPAAPSECSLLEPTNSSFILLIGSDYEQFDWKEALADSEDVPISTSLLQAIVMDDIDRIDND